MTPLVWFITGCSSGFGAQFAEEVLRRGHQLVATARTVEALAPLACLAPERVLTLPLDVTDCAAITSAVSAALGRFSRIDVVVNNAGYGVVGAWEEVDDATLRAQFDTNVFGAAAVIRALLPTLRGQGSGHIVNMSSVAGVRASPGLGTYAATKHAVEALSESLAAEVAPFGISVTMVEPGAFRTAWAGRSMRGADPIAAYASGPVGQVRRALASFDGAQMGDPAAAAHILLDVIEAGHPPLRLPLGSDAVAGLHAKAQALAETATEWASVAGSAQFADTKGTT